MKIVINPLGQMVNNYLMKMALPLAGWFIVEYFVRNASATHVLLSLLTIPMMIFTPIIIWRIMRKLRREILFDTIHGIQAWSFGVQLTFFAGLIEALFIYVYNQFLFPGNLAAVMQASIAQYEEVYNTLKELNAYPTMLPKFQETLDALKEAPIPSPIEAAIEQLSNEIFLALLYMIPLAVILRKKPQLPPQEQ